MSKKDLPNRTQRFFQVLEATSPAFVEKVYHALERHPSDFVELSELMLGWAEASLGKDCYERLIQGYRMFVVDVNRSQVKYERRGHYEFKNYKEVAELVYNEPEFMSDYHWGVYVTTFAWEHHLRIHRFFKTHFLENILATSTAPRLLDLGCGSGIWSLLCLSKIPESSSTMVDISPTTTKLTAGMLDQLGFASRGQVVEADALTYKLVQPVRFAMSCFLMEHLENPDALLKNLAANLDTRGYAFVTTALTAAETDHIYEFRRESEVVEMAERAGFRVIATLSAAPENAIETNKYLPRSMALVLQKRGNEIW